MEGPPLADFFVRVGLQHFREAIVDPDESLSPICDVCVVLEDKGESFPEDYEPIRKVRRAPPRRPRASLAIRRGCVLATARPSTRGRARPIAVASDRVPPLFPCERQTIGGLSADLDGSFFFGSRIFLGVRRSVREPAIVDIDLQVRPRNPRSVAAPPDAHARGRRRPSSPVRTPRGPPPPPTLQHPRFFPVTIVCFRTPRCSSGTCRPPTGGSAWRSRRVTGTRT